jgi:hypothetical protein
MATEDVPTWAKVAIAVVLFAITISTTAGGIAWAMGKNSTSHDYVVDSLLKTDIRHDRLISDNAKDISDVKEGQHEAEVARTKLEGKMDVFVSGQQATTKELTELKDVVTDLSDYLKLFNYDKKKETK